MTTSASGAGRPRKRGEQNPFDGLFDDLKHSIKCLNQGFSLYNPRLVERYLNGQIHFIARFFMGDVSLQYVAVFQKRREGHGDGDWVGPFAGQRGRFFRHVFQKAPSLASYADGHQGAMLIDDVQTVKTPYGIAPTLVGFERVEQLESIWPDARYYSRAGVFVRFGRIMDGELVAAIERMAMDGDEQRIQMVKRATQAVEHVSGDDGHHERHGLRCAPSDVAFAGIDVTLVDDVVRVGIKKPFDQCAQLADVLVGPFDLAVNCVCGR
jgi:hypothetical protein